MGDEVVRESHGRVGECSLSFYIFKMKYLLICLSELRTIFIITFLVSRYSKLDPSIGIDELFSILFKICIFVLRVFVHLDFSVLLYAAQEF